MYAESQVPPKPSRSTRTKGGTYSWKTSEEAEPDGKIHNMAKFRQSPKSNKSKDTLKPGKHHHPQDYTKWNEVFKIELLSLKSSMQKLEVLK